MITRFPRWKYLLLVVALIVGFIYALPNLYGEDPAIQITGLKGKEVTNDVLTSIREELKKADFGFKSAKLENESIMVRFNSTETQLKAIDNIKTLLNDDDYSVALNLAPMTPHWLDSMGAKPMKLGLDLRGGVRFLMDVDVASSYQRRLEGFYGEIRNGLREKRIQYRQLKQFKDDTIRIRFASDNLLDEAATFIRGRFPELVMEKNADNRSLVLSLNPSVVIETRNYTMEQTVSTLRNRVNELGVAEAIVQRQGMNRVVVELPGIQDTARAKDILGKTATLDFVMVDHDADIRQALMGKVPPGARILYDRGNRPWVVKKRVILTGDSITGATSGYDNRDGAPVVSVRLGGAGIGLFKKTTQESIGKRMAVVYRESSIEEKVINGETVKQKKIDESLISVATIQSALGSQFQITGLTVEEARDLALLLRAGALPVTVSIVEERIVGPSMGQENIQKGVISVAVGLGLVLVFMMIYYSLFGVIANLALVLNLVLLVSIMSLLGATLTLPGIAGIVLTLGMAVDANVLIFERIREELRTGMSPQASIHRGFDHAFATIVDANLTTLIVGIILFAVGTGPVKGFAVTLSIGILTSMFTAITGTRAMVELFYRGGKQKKILVGI